MWMSCSFETRWWEAKSSSLMASGFCVSLEVRLSGEIEGAFGGCGLVKNDPESYQVTMDSEEMR